MVDIAAVSHCTTLASYTTTWWLLRGALWTGNMDDKTCVIAGQVVDFVELVGNDRKKKKQSAS